MVWNKTKPCLKNKEFDLNLDLGPLGPFLFHQGECAYTWTMIRSCYFDIILKDSYKISLVSENNDKCNSLLYLTKCSVVNWNQEIDNVSFIKEREPGT